MISSGGLELPAPKVRNAPVLASAPVPVTRTLVDDADATVSASEDDMSTNFDEVSHDSSHDNSRVSSGVSRRYGRDSSCYTYSEVSSSRETSVGAREQTEPRFDSDMDDESTDSATSSQISMPPPAGKINGGVSLVETHSPKTDGRTSVEKVKPFA